MRRFFRLIWAYLTSLVFPPGSQHVPKPTTKRSNGRRDFRWSFHTMQTDHHLVCSVDYREDAYQESQSQLRDERPGKVYHCSDQECAVVARLEIYDEHAGFDSDEVRQISDYLRKYADNEMLSNYQYANLILSFVHEQCIPYSYDKDSTGFSDYFRYPIETIVDKTGDCDCKAVLACALYKAAGFDVVFALMPGHAALAISSEESLPFAYWNHGGKRWYYSEATGDYWTPGQIPDGVDEIEFFDL